MKRIPMDAQRARCLRDVVSIDGHGGNDVLAFEGSDGLFQCDAVSDQLVNDLIETIVNTQHGFPRR